MKLEEQKRLLLEARLDALQRQINPHFLFNTLNSIASLVRMKPELAREMTVKLANILRALLKDHDSYVPLSEELKFTDDYLDIEVVRFGADKLRVEKEIDPRTLEVLVPSILLAAADRKQHQARPGAAHARGHGHAAQPARRRPRADRSGRRRSGHGQPAGLGAQPQRRGHRHEKCAGAAGGALRQPGAASAWSAIRAAARWSRSRFRPTCRRCLKQGSYLELAACRLPIRATSHCSYSSLTDNPGFLVALLGWAR